MTDLSHMSYEDLLHHLRKDLLLDANTDTLTGSILQALIRDTTTTTPGYSTATKTLALRQLGVGDPAQIFLNVNTALAANTSTNTYATAGNNVISFDPSGRMSTTGFYTCRTTGYYLVTSQVGYSTIAANGASIQIASFTGSVSVTVIENSVTNSAGSGSATISQIVPVTAGDVLGTTFICSQANTMLRVGALGRITTLFSVMQVN